MLEKNIEDLNVKIQEDHEEDRERQENKAIDKISLNPKEFFKYESKTKKTKSRVGPLRYGVSYYSGPREMARILSDQYKNVFSTPRDSYDQIFFEKKTIASLSDITLTKVKFVVAMQSIKYSSAPGPDGAPTFLFRKYAEALALPVMLMWQASLDSGIMPERTLLAYITPILKSVDRSVPANYRPVSLTNHLTKIFERVIRLEMVQHLESNELMNKTQHGFRERYSTITQILCFYDSVLSFLEEGYSVDAIYLDFSKAFDKVDHQILLKKAESLGIEGKLLQWIREFLTNRQQQVKVSNTLSQKEWVRSGVPQGSVLGPLLFLIMLFDIDKDVKHSILGSYADDTRLWRFIHGEGDQDLLQRDLQILYGWADDNNKTFNDDKFESVSMGLPNARYYTTPTGKVIKRKEHVKDLGVYISSDCTFDYHIAACAKSASQMSAWILRTFLSRDKRVMKVLLKSILVPKCEYASVVWSPFDNRNINLIENVQRRFSSKIRDYQAWDEEHSIWHCNVSYAERLQDLKVYSLERRRERVMVLYMYRYIIGLLPFPWFQTYEERGIKVRSKYKRQASPKVRRCRHSSFFYKGPQLYNLMPSELRMFEEIDIPHKGHVDTFKGKLDKFLEKLPDEPTVGGNPRRAATNSLICQIPFFRRRNHIHG